jgi:hypothetical protein
MEVSVCQNKKWEDSLLLEKKSRVRKEHARKNKPF